jgi:hypothetical protein
MSTIPEESVGNSNQDQVDEIQHVALEGHKNIIPNQRLCEQCRSIRLSVDDLLVAFSTEFSYIPKKSRTSFRIGVHNGFYSVQCPFCWLLQES